MKPFAETRQSLWLAVLVFIAGRVPQVFANPTGLTVGAGSATAQQIGSLLNVAVSQSAILNWQSFNIGAGETTRFLQPSANSVVFNLIGDANPSQIFGNLNANGTVILANANGFYFGPDSMIKVGGSFVATTAPVAPDLGGGAGWQFTGMPPLASIVNYGQIEVGAGKSLFLIAENIENHGDLAAPGGDVGLYAGDSVLVSERPDGRGLSAVVQMPAGSVDNFGRVTADGGSIVMQAKVVNQDGILQADSIAEKNGVIELVAADQLNLGANSQILARGDAAAASSTGGNLTLKSENIFSDTAGSQLVTTGGANGGNGGNIEVSAPNILSLNSAMDARAQNGFTGGEFLLDPVNIVLGTSGSGTVPANGTVAFGTAGTLNLNVNTAFANKNFSNLKLQATGNITFTAGTAWNLSASTGQTAGLLTLQAGGDIIFNNNSKLTDANGWSVSLNAGYNFNNGTFKSASGNIYLDGSNGGTANGSISTAAGNVNLAAGNGIQIGSGVVGTTGGNVTWQAGGDIAFGKNSQITTAATGAVLLEAGYNFASSAINSASGNIYLGGSSGGTANGSISTVAGNVNLAAGNGIQIGSGVVGTTGGNVTWQAGGDIAFGKNSKLTTAANGAVELEAGFNFASSTINSGSGNIFLNGTSGGSLSGSILTAGGNIDLAAGSAIQIGSGIVSTAGGNVIWQAGGDITFGKNAILTTAANGAVTLDAGYDFSSGNIKSGADSSGSGNIFLNGGGSGTLNGTITTAGGDINLLAWESILVGSGSVFTTGGGSIFAFALNGNINAGTYNGGTSSTDQQGSDYNFDSSGYKPNTVLGGFSTAAGGNVTLLAGNNIDSTPTVPKQQAPGASGTYGAGDVTVIAGNQITGNYTLADGVGTMLAGVPVSLAQAGILENPSANPSSYAATLSGLELAVMQSQNASGNIGAAPVAGVASISPVTFSVINGAWNVWAANDISIKEVNNPNGAFNKLQPFLFDYAPDASATFWAGNAIELVGANLNRLTSVNKTPIYAPRLSLNAGAGGVLIDKSIILAPSSEGSLSLITRNGGNLTGAVTAGSTVLNGIIMSDSASPVYTTFSKEQDGIHLHDQNQQPVLLDISGSIGSFSLTVPTFADITVRGTKPFVTADNQNVFGTYNFGFKGQNLSAGQTTSINVLGSITYRGDLTTIGLTDPLPATLFTDSADKAVTSRLIYDATTKQLIFVGVMSPADEAFLLAPSILKLDQFGNPITQPVLDADGNPKLDVNGNPETVPVTQPLVLDATQQNVIKQLYTATLTASLGGQGLALAGPGNFNVSADTMDLGVSGGIQVTAPNAALTAITPYGANLKVTTVGDLTMTSTVIANESLLGGVSLNVGGALDVGGQFTTLDDAGTPKGIFSTSGGDLSVLVHGSVNVNGSRIAAYNGGNVTVESLNGDVNAGTGGNGFVSMNALELDPTTGLLRSLAASIPGSGILATTVAGSHVMLGNILIETPNGNISASQGGVIQIAFNGTDTSHVTTELLAGYELRDAGGHRVLAANLAGGTPVRVSDARNLDASGSGVIAQSIIAKATGEAKGLFIGLGSGPVVISAGTIGPGLVFSSGKVTLTSDDSSGGPTIQVISEQAHTDNGVSAATVLPVSNVAKNDAPTADTAATVAAKADDTSGQGDDLTGNKNKGKGITLARKISRVTVLLPGQN